MEIIDPLNPEEPTFDDEYRRLARSDSPYEARVGQMMLDLIDEIRRKERHLRSDVERLKDMTKTFPDCAELWDALGDVMQICADADIPVADSVECYKLAIRCQPDYAPAHESLGYAYDIYYDDFDRAAEHFRLALANGAGDTARIGLARVLAQLGRSDAALSCLDECSNQESSAVRVLRREVSEGLWFDSPID